MIIISWVGDSLVSIQAREEPEDEEDDDDVEDFFISVPKHNGENPREAMRIYKHGGETRQGKFDKRSKIYQRTRMYPGVQVTRSLGDLIAHHIGVTSEPQFVVHDIAKADAFMTIATDSVWK
jgi:hypothetical protein